MIRLTWKNIILVENSSRKTTWKWSLTLNNLVRVSVAQWFQLDVEQLLHVLFQLGSLFRLIGIVRKRPVVYVQVQI